jgi:radial spoke head protein 1
MNDEKNGYGINRWKDGEIFYGEYKNNKRDGQGYYKWANGNEYWGMWKNGMK